MHILELRDIVKEYKTGRTSFLALRGVSLGISRGEFVSIMGPSGSGKSTMLHFLGFLDKPSSGEVLIDGRPMSGMDGDGLAAVRNEKIGYVFQSFNLAPTLSVAKNVELPLIIRETDRSEREAKVREMLSLVRLLPKWDSLPSQLSGGEKQRVAIARALATNPDIILADEPTGSLDSQTGEEIMELIKELSSESRKTVILVTHEAYLTKFADRTLKIRDGIIRS